MLCDTHVHLDDNRFLEDFEDVLHRACVDSNIGFMLNISCNTEGIASSLKLAKQYDNIYAALGFHPHHAKDVTDKDMLELADLVKQPKVLAIGEIGLDYNFNEYNQSNPDVQKTVFKQQIQVARDAGLPIVIHARDSYEDIAQILKSENAGEIGGVMHCFGGDLEMMDICLNMNFMIGLGGIVTFKNAHLAKEIAKEVPLDKLLLETDAPYLAPHPYRGKRNEPAYVSLVAQTIAEIKGLDVEEVIEKTGDNARNLFKF